MGHPVLRQRGRLIEKSDFRNPMVQKLIDDMLETMHEYNGVGLAAPQVHASLRLFVALLEDEPDGKSAATVVINPEIVANSQVREEGWEGCLSIPDIRGRVTRAREIKVKAYDRRARRIEITARNFTARVIQHETDHLDGVLFFDRMASFETLTFLEEFGKYWSRRPVPEE